MSSGPTGSRNTGLDGEEGSAGLLAFRSSGIIKAWVF